MERLPSVAQRGRLELPRSRPFSRLEGGRNREEEAVDGESGVSPPAPRRTGAEDVWGRGRAWAAAGAPMKTPEFRAAWAFLKRPHFTEETAD